MGVWSFLSGCFIRVFPFAGVFFFFLLFWFGSVSCCPAKHGHFDVFYVRKYLQHHKFHTKLVAAGPRSASTIFLGVSVFFFFLLLIFFCLLNRNCVCFCSADRCARHLNCAKEIKRKKNGRRRRRRQLLVSCAAASMNMKSNRNYMYFHQIWVLFRLC